MTKTNDLDREQASVPSVMANQNVIRIAESGGNPIIKMARLIMAAKTDPMRENTREEWLASTVLGLKDQSDRQRETLVKIREWLLALARCGSEFPQIIDLVKRTLDGTETPAPDPAVMRDYIIKLTAFWMENPGWTELANEARGCVGALNTDGAAVDKA